MRRLARTLVLPGGAAVVGRPPYRNEWDVQSRRQDGGSPCSGPLGERALPGDCRGEF